METLFTSTLRIQTTDLSFFDPGQFRGGGLGDVFFIGLTSLVFAIAFSSISYCNLVIIYGQPTLFSITEEQLFSVVSSTLLQNIKFVPWFINIVILVVLFSRRIISSAKAIAAT